MSMRNLVPIYTDKAPRPIGPYSQGIIAGDLICFSGQIALDPATGIMVGNTVEEQTVRIMATIKSLLSSQGLTVRSIVRCMVYLKSIAAFSEFNAVYERELEGWKPARSVVEVTALPKNALVEIEVTACR